MKINDESLQSLTTQRNQWLHVIDDQKFCGLSISHRLLIGHHNQWLINWLPTNYMYSVLISLMSMISLISYVWYSLFLSEALIYQLYFMYVWSDGGSISWIEVIKHGCNKHVCNNFTDCTSLIHESTVYCINHRENLTSPLCTRSFVYINKHQTKIRLTYLFIEVYRCCH